ncbi:MAG: hypothetical protein M0P12_03340 [Paludibacteraceae bacterium]|nr:hypothetical protein [Paludibacteraceae bacterium]
MTMLSRGLKPYGNIKDGKQIRIFSHVRKDKIEISEEEYDECICDVYVDIFGDFYMPRFCLDRESPESAYPVLQKMDIGIPTIVDEI